MPLAAASSRKAVFLDVDGTYADHGEVPPGHRDAVRAARAAGHLVFLCTGRPVSLLSPHIVEAGFDGYVAGAGAYARLGDELLLDSRFPEELARHALDRLVAHDALFLLEAPAATHASPATVEAMGRYLGPGTASREPTTPSGHGGRDLLEALTATEDLGAVSFAKISTFHAALPVAELAAEIGPEVASIPSSMPDLGPGAGEIYRAGTHKAVGMAAIVTRLGLARDRIIAFGDGLNDVEMLEYAGLGVAIEGADDAVLAVADRTAAGPGPAGLAAAFAELGLT